MSLPAFKRKCVFLLATALTAFAAGGKLDLERVAPVPADQPIPVQDFFRPPQLSGPKINAAGTFFAAFIDLGDHTALLVCDLGKLSVDMLRGSANKDLYRFIWLDQNQILTSWSADKLYADGLYVTRAADLRENYAVEALSATLVVGVPRDTPLKPLVWIMQNAYDGGKDAGVVQIDTTKRLGANRDALPGSMQARAAEEETSLYGARASIVRSFPVPRDGVVISYMADKDGHLAFATTADAGVYTLLRLEQGKWLKCPVDLDVIDILGAGDKAGELIVVGPHAEGKPRPLQRLDAVSGALGEVLFQDKAYDPSDWSLIRQPGTGIVLGGRITRGRIVTVWFDEAYQQVQKMVEANLTGQVVQLLGSDDAERRFLVAGYSDRQPVTYYSLDVRTRALNFLKSSAPWIVPERMQPMNTMRFKTRDGHVLEGYVTLPAGTTKEHPAPLVVLPHGGPWARDAWGFDGEVQFLASRGYAVLQPNYRGSTGYDWMFPSADLWAFRKMHDDVTDAVKTLVTTGLVDRTRMAIMGTSFGGYLAMSGAAFEPGLYRCAVTISGVFDYAQVMKEAKYDQYTSAKFGILQRNLGDPKTRAAEFAAAAPLRHVDQVTIPIFVAHGKEDSVAEVTESFSLIDELEKHHVPHETMIVSGEGHGMHFLKNEVDLYTRIEAFLAKNLAPAPSVAARP
jgi:cephalosporin-C deacetylase-like acetyl esterase